MNIQRHTLLILLLTCATVFALGQERKARSGGRQMIQVNADETVVMLEIGTLVILEEKALRVQLLPIPGGRSVDIQDGDEVGMANGKRMSSIDALRAEYEKVKEGEEFKMGIRRDGRSHIIAFVRKDGGNIGGGGRMVVRRGPSGDNEDIFPALGFGIVTSDGKTTVNLMMPSAPKELAEGDEVVSINGKAVKTSADFSQELDATEIGGKLNMTFRRGDKEYTVAMDRPEPPRGMRMIRR